MPEETTPQTQEGTPPETPAESLETYKSRLAQLEQELAQTKKGLSTAHQTLTEKDKALKRSSDLESKIVGIEDRIELLATAIATKTSIEDAETELPKDKRQDILGNLQRQKQEQDARRKADEYNRQADSIFNRAKAVFGDDDDAIERVENALRLGNLERAESRVAKAETAKATTQETVSKSKESEEERIKKMAEERAKAILKEKGILIDETGGPSAASTSLTEARAKYARGEISETEARKAGLKFV